MKITQDLILDSDLTINEDLIVDNATLDLNGYTLTVNGNLTVQGNNGYLKMLNGIMIKYPVSYPISFIYDNKIYVLGGELEDNSTTDKIQYYDINEKSWKVLQTLLITGRSNACGAFYNGKFYIFGGYNKDSDQNLKSIEVFDPSSSTISLSSSDLPYDLKGCIVC